MERKKICEVAVGDGSIVIIILILVPHHHDLHERHDSPTAGVAHAHRHRHRPSQGAASSFWGERDDGQNHNDPLIGEKTEAEAASFQSVHRIRAAVLNPPASRSFKHSNSIEQPVSLALNVGGKCSLLSLTLCPDTENKNRTRSGKRQQAAVKTSTLQPHLS